MKDNYFRVYTQRLAAYFILKNMNIRKITVEDNKFVFHFDYDKEKIESILREYDNIVHGELFF